MSELQRKFGRSVLSPLLYGLLTGAICGCILALFLICSRVVIGFTFDLYETRDGALTVVCILVLALLCCLLTAVIQTLCPSAKGSGIPLAEGAARGMLKVKWLASAAALISGSLLSFLCGMPLGSEGPSVGVGGLIGEGVGKTSKKPVAFRRLLITGGASAGLATAFNAPLTGICFAFEETHRRFSPHIFAATLSAVVAAVGTSQAIFFGFGHIPFLNAAGVREGFCVLPFLAQSSYATAGELFKICGAAVVCGIACAIIGIGFNRATRVLSRLFAKIKSTTLRLLPVYLLAAACGLSLFLTAGSGEAALARITKDATIYTVIIVLAVRFVTTAAASGAGATGGLFLPMIAIGGLTGTLASSACTAGGMSVAYSPNITMICICAFFAASVRAPITAIALSAELSGSFVNLLPCAVAVATAAVLSDLSGTEPLYERMLDDIQRAAPIPPSAKCLTVCGSVGPRSAIAFMRVRNVMWPYNSLVTELDRNGTDLVPDGETVLLPGDMLTVRAENVVPDFFFAQIREYIDVKSERASPPSQ